jgi:hypothetical protein
MSQINTSVCMGMGNIGRQRLKIYRQGIKARGYKSLSKFVIDILDRELHVTFSNAERDSCRQNNERVRKIAAI